MTVLKFLVLHSGMVLKFLTTQTTHPPRKVENGGSRLMNRHSNSAVPLKTSLTRVFKEVQFNTCPSELTILG